MQRSNTRLHARRKWAWHANDARCIPSRRGAVAMIPTACMSALTHCRVNTRYISSRWIHEHSGHRRCRSGIRTAAAPGTLGAGDEVLDTNELMKLISLLPPTVRYVGSVAESGLARNTGTCSVAWQFQVPLGALHHQKHNATGTSALSQVRGHNTITS
jgi:hypothetical protein